MPVAPVLEAGTHWSPVLGGGTRSCPHAEERGGGHPSPCAGDTQPSPEGEVQGVDDGMSPSPGVGEGEVANDDRGLSPGAGEVQGDDDMSPSPEEGEEQGDDRQSSPRRRV